MAAEIQVLEYLDSHVRSPFAAWFEGLNAPEAAKVTAALYQLAGAIGRVSKEWGEASTSAKSTLAQVTGSISARMETGS